MEPLLVGPSPLLVSLGYTASVMAVAAASCFGIGSALKLSRTRKTAARRSEGLLIRSISADGIITHKNGTFSRLIGFRGADTSTMTAQDQSKADLDLVDWISALANSGITARLYTFTGKAETPVIPTPDFQPLTQMFGRYRDSLAPFFDRQHLLALTSTKHGEEGRTELKAAVTATLTRLEAYSPRLMSQEEGEVFSILARILSPGHAPCLRGAVEDVAPDLMVDDEGPGADGQSFTLQGPTGSKHVAIWTIRRLGNASDTSLSQALSAIPCTSVTLHAFKPLSEQMSLLDLEVRKKFWEKNRSKKLDERVEQAKDAILSGESNERLTRYFTCFMAIVDDPADFVWIDDRVKAAGIVDNFSYKREGALLADAYAGMVPGHPLPLARFSYQASDVAAAVNLTSGHQGHKRNQWANRPLDYLRTWNGALYGWGWHSVDGQNEPLGHGAVFGEPASGKTTRLLLQAMASLSVENLRVFWFDCFEAAYPMARFLELGGLGRHLSVVEEGMASNPCQLPDHPQNRAHIANLMKLMLGATRDNPVAPVIDRHIRMAVDINYSEATPRHLRNLMNIVAAAFPSPATVGADPLLTAAHETLMHWVGPKGPGAFLNAPEDRMSFRAGADDPADTRFFCIDFEPLRTDPQKAALFMADVSHRIMSEMRDSGTPFLIVIDETKQSLQLPGMPEWLEALHSLARRMNGAIWTIWQRPDQLEEAGVSAVIRQNAPTKIIYPSPNASREIWAAFLEAPSDALLDAIGKRSISTKQLLRPAIVLRPDHWTVLEMHASAMGQPAMSLIRGTKSAKDLHRLEERMSPMDAVSMFITSQAA